MQPKSPFADAPTPSPISDRRALVFLVATCIFTLVGLFVPNAIFAYRLRRIVDHGGRVTSRSDYLGERASRFLGRRFHYFYSDHYVIRDYYDVFLGDTERGIEGCGMGISYADAPANDVRQDPGNDGPMLVRALGRVRRVSFAETSVTDDGLAPLAGMTSIEFLDLSSTLVRGPGLGHLRGLPLQSLSLHSTPLDDAGLAHLPAMPNLKVLDLGETRISPAFMSRLPAFPGLTYLTLRGLAITDEHVRELSTLPLVNLDLSNTQITAASIPHLEKMPDLYYVHLCQTKISIEEAAKSSHVAIRGWATMSKFLCTHR